MNTLKAGKVSMTMKDALIRNNIVEQNMKTTFKSLQCVSNKEMAFLKNKQALYLKRQKQLKKSLESRNDPATSPLSPDLEVRTFSGPSFGYTAESTSFQNITELQARPKSALRSPSIEISYFDESGSEQTQIKLPPLSSGNRQLTTGSPMRARSKSTSDISKSVAEFLKKPLIADGAGSWQGRRTSSGGMRDDIGLIRRPSQSLTTPNDASNTSRSAPSSPILLRRQLPGTQLPNQKSARRGSSATQRQAVADDNSESLSDSMDKIKFCRYLRDSEMKLDYEDHLPDEVKPTALIVGHTKAVL